MLIVAVDNGYGNMKTAACTFPAGLVAYEDKPYFTENLMIYNDRYYIIGSGHKEFNPLKITDEDNYVLTLAAIARELGHQKITASKVVLATGLPLTWMVRQQESYRKYLLQNRTVDFNFRGVDYHIEMVDAMVFPQGYAAIADHLGEFRGVNILADIGNGTVNLLRLVDRRADVASMATEACGVKDCAIAMRTALANRHGGAKVDDSIIERIIRTGTAQIDGGYLKTLTGAAVKYTEELLRKFREYGYDEKTMRLYVVGGGGCLLRNFGNINTDRVTINSDIRANAKGYEFLAYERMRKRGVEG
jgi:plasmid segregation protein ParM